MTQLELPLATAKPKRPERRSAARKSIDSMVAHIYKTGAAHSYEDLLDQIAGVPNRALFNALLAILQLPHATMLCSAAEWEGRWGRRVLPEQRPLVLMFPFGPVEFVFDLSQTEPTDHARTLPIDSAPFAMDPVRQAGETVARLIYNVQELGVRVVTARQGVGLAGKIHRSTEAGVLPIPGSGKQPPRQVPVRWVVALNETHPPTVQLATLAHELGHLFCGHVGADRGDSWPWREVEDHTTREFEAESVARLVFRRIAPTAKLPAYLEHLLAPGEPLPDGGWTYVAQAADRVLEMASDTADDSIDLRAKG